MSSFKTLRQENDDQSGRNNDQDSRSETPLPTPSLKAESVNSDSAKSVSRVVTHTFLSRIGSLINCISWEICLVA